MIALRYRIAGRAMRLYAWAVRPRTFGVRALLLDPGGRIALVRHHYIAGWYLPGGGVNKGESATAAIRRELREEIGLAHVEIAGVLGIYHNRAEAKDDHVVVFIATVPAGAIPVAADRREIAEAGWFAADALPDDTSPATRRRIAEHLAGRQGHGAW
ncbi:NUDIX domain-containing protein [uncultured Sphingomonas sp.]|uniref:NUDIX domain-containing protein n=1 Tax=uncultured Sphingomonas sp. TaxID=158754 RepID=UPI00262E66E9|nr:NUDIX domain-containing protein [uncultured Sphingomonas sp.]